MARNDRQNKERYDPDAESKSITISEETAGIKERALAEPKEVYFCGRGSQWDDGSAQMLREFKRDELKEGSGKRPRMTRIKIRTETPATKELLDSQRRVKSNPKTYNGLDDLDELQGMIDATIRIEKEYQSERKIRLDAMEYKTGCKIDNLKDRFLNLGNRVESMGEKLSRESKLLEEETLLKTAEFCQYADVKAMMAVAAERTRLFKSEEDESSFSAQMKEWEELGGDPAERGTRLYERTSEGFEIMMRSTAKGTTPFFSGLMNEETRKEYAEASIDRPPVINLPNIPSRGEPLPVQEELYNVEDEDLDVAEGAEAQSVSDSTCFPLPCSVGILFLSQCLVDLKSQANFISNEAAKRIKAIGYGEIKQSYLKDRTVDAQTEMIVGELMG